MAHRTQQTPVGAPIEPRLLLLFWHLADRWGRVGRVGLAIPLRLTHEVIAQLVGAQRPTVSTARCQQ